MRNTKVTLRISGRANGISISPGRFPGSSWKGENLKYIAQNISFIHSSIPSFNMSLYTCNNDWLACLLTLTCLLTCLGTHMSILLLITLPPTRKITILDSTHLSINKLGPQTVDIDSYSSSTGPFGILCRRRFRSFWNEASLGLMIGNPLMTKWHEGSQTWNYSMSLLRHFNEGLAKFVRPIILCNIVFVTCMELYRYNFRPVARGWGGGEWGGGGWARRPPQPAVVHLFNIFVGKFFNEGSCWTSCCPPRSMYRKVPPQLLQRAARLPVSQAFPSLANLAMKLCSPYCRACAALFSSPIVSRALQTYTPCTTALSVAY